MYGLFLKAGSERLFVPAAAVVEVTHAVPLHPLLGGEFVAGAFRFRGHVIPVLDLCQLLTGTGSVARLRTRIVVVGLPADARLLGLLAEQVLDLRALEPDGPEYPAEPAGSRRPPLGAMVSDAEGFVRLPNVAEMVSWVYSRSPLSESTGERP